MSDDGLIQTIAILAAALVFVTKTTIEMWAKKKNGGGNDSATGFLTQNQRDRYLSDLEKSHRPVTDPVTGQPKFPWYGDSAPLIQQMRANEEATTALRIAIRELNGSVGDALTALSTPKAEPADDRI